MDSLVFDEDIAIVQSNSALLPKHVLLKRQGKYWKPNSCVKTCQASFTLLHHHLGWHEKFPATCKLVLPLAFGQLPPWPLLNKNSALGQLCRGTLFVNFAGVWYWFTFKTVWFCKLYSSGPNFTGMDFTSPHTSHNSILNPTRLNPDNTTSLKQVDDREEKANTINIKQKGQTLNQQRCYKNTHDGVL